MQVNFNFPTKNERKKVLGNLYGVGLSYSVFSLITQTDDFIVLIVPNLRIAEQIERELKFFISNDENLNDFPILNFPDWETLPYDNFSPHQDIISDRLTTLYKLSSYYSFNKNADLAFFENENNNKKGLLIISASTLMHKLPPQEYIMQNVLMFEVGDKINLVDFRKNLEKYNYIYVSNVSQHGEFAVRGSLLDVFPMGSNEPYRIDLFDDEIESIRIFDPITQRTKENIQQIELLPGKEFPLSDESIKLFRNNWRLKFSGNPRNCPIYENISNKIPTSGLEYYLPLFFEKTEDIFSYIPQNSIVVNVSKIDDVFDNFWSEINSRYARYSHDIIKPILKPNEMFLEPQIVFQKMKNFLQINLLEDEVKTTKKAFQNYDISKFSDISVAAEKADPLFRLKNFIKEKSNKKESNKIEKILFCVETNGRKEVLKNLFSKNKFSFKEISGWMDFASYIESGDKENDNEKSDEIYSNSNKEIKCFICVSPINDGAIFNSLKFAIITEHELFGSIVRQRRRRKERKIDPDIEICNLAELNINDPVVHINYGIGRYLGLQKLTLAKGTETEFVILEYQKGDKIYLPVNLLHLISRYSAENMENPPINYLGTDKWDKEKEKALKKVTDVAAELLDIYARRKAKVGFSFKKPDKEYDAFVSKFPFEETIDQENAINDVLSDLTSNKVMDRVICGDVGFGKTEVCMRAAFIAVQSGKQVAMLVPTTLLSEQHHQTFIDRFSNFPINIEVLSRFSSQKEQTRIVNDLVKGKCDIVIGTHKILQDKIKFKDLGLLIIDEEHRFGVRQKDKFKSLRAEIDILTLTATPIPRTLNLAISKVRDLSIIATPPSKRLSVKTFVREYDENLVLEAIERELNRGGQVYYLHNSIETIDKVYDKVKNILPNIKASVAHGRMPERELERVMVDFYHRRTNVLICTTIIETGIDIPTANTIIIERADKFGLAQLHQLRGRVGRSHHQAYAFCLIPEEDDKKITNDAKKRLDALSSLETLGSGFTLATYDLEIRGAGELLGKEQSGNINSIGFNLYMELIEKAVKNLQNNKNAKDSKEDLLDLVLNSGCEIDLQIPNLIPENYISSVNTRLVLYKRIANAKTESELNELKVEMIDRFGLLPDYTLNLFEITKLKLIADQLGICKIKMSKAQGVIEFIEKPKVSPEKIILLVTENSKIYSFVGSSKIKINKDFNDFAEKIKFLEDFFQKIR